MVDAILAWLAALPPWALYAALMALSAVENVFPPVPADVAVALGAFLAQRGHLSVPLLGALCWLANTASATGMYFLGRVYGPDFFRSGWPRRLLPPEALRALHDAYERHGVLGIFVSRFFPGVRAAVTPFAGVAGLEPWKALPPAVLASFIWYGLLVAAGSALGLQWEGVKGLVERVNWGLGIAGLIATAAVLYWLWRRAKTGKR